MALAATTLNGAITAGQTLVTLTSGTGATKKGLLRVDGEGMLITDITNTPTVQVVRGYNIDGQAASGIAVAHTTLAPAVVGQPSEFSYQSTIGPAYISYGIDGAIAVPTRPTVAQLTKATAGAYTLAAPAADLNGVVLTITSTTAAAHVVTATGLFQDGTTTVNTCTFAAQLGCSIELVAMGGKWNVLAIGNTGTTFA